MKKFTIYDPAMCCSTGVCGPGVDPVLARFSADLEWLAGKGVSVIRHNLSQEPGAFAGEPKVQMALEAGGVDCLPILLVDGEIVSQGKYPSRSQLAGWAGTPLEIPVQSASASNCAPDEGKGCC